MDLRVQCRLCLRAQTAHAFIASVIERILVVGAEVHSNGLEFPRGRDTIVVRRWRRRPHPRPNEQGTSTSLPRRANTLSACGWRRPAAFNPMVTHEMIEEGMMYPKMDGRYVLNTPSGYPRS